MAICKGERKPDSISTDEYVEVVQPENKVEEVIVDNPAEADLHASLLKVEGTPIGDPDIVVEERVDAPYDDND